MNNDAKNDAPPTADASPNQTLPAARGSSADRIVEHLRSAIVDGAAGLADTPALVKRVLNEELWRVRPTGLGDEPQEFTTFAEFVRARPPAGLGTTVETLMRLCETVPDALDLLIRQLPERKRGGDRRSQKFQSARRAEDAMGKVDEQNCESNGEDNFKSDNVTFENDQTAAAQQKFSAPKRGNSKQYSLCRLREQKPDFYAAVLRGEMSAHKAMIRAGLRRPQFTLFADNPVQAAIVLTRRFDRAALGEIIRLLTNFVEREQD